MIGCLYTISLRRHDDAWSVSSSRVHMLYEEGNHDLENVARHRVAR
nr:hypothetical protein [Kibdelosporangium sp. MJ126-NF4]CTQ93868.1 hypothetical protein [Kibdelosporangium sp. MJ126-NF4]